MWREPACRIRGGGGAPAATTVAEGEAVFYVQICAVRGGYGRGAPCCREQGASASRARPRRLGAGEVSGLGGSDLGARPTHPHWRFSCPEEGSLHHHGRLLVEAVSASGGAAQPVPLAWSYNEDRRSWGFLAMFSSSWSLLSSSTSLHHCTYWQSRRSPSAATATHEGNSNHSTYSHASEYWSTECGAVASAHIPAQPGLWPPRSIWGILT